MGRRTAGLVATDAVRLLLAVLTVAVATTMVVRGSRPDAELEGVLVVIGGGLAALTVPYLVVTVVALVALVRGVGRGQGLTTGLALVDVAVGLVALVALARAVQDGTGLLRPAAVGLLPLSLGLATLVLARPPGGPSTPDP